LKELVDSDLIEHMFSLARRKTSEVGDLWWQIRALQELGWNEQLDEVLVAHAEEIEASGDIHLRVLLAGSKGDERQYIDFMKQEAAATYLLNDSSEDDEDNGDAKTGAQE
jgi:hypothetical protein